MAVSLPASSAVATGPVRLTGFLTYPNIRRRDKDGTETVIEGKVRASEQVEPGVYWISLQDVIVMLTGKGEKAVQSQINRDIGSEDSPSFCRAVVERKHVLAQFGNNRWGPVPAIKSTDLINVATALNTGIANAAATAFTRVLGGDATLHGEVDRNAARQAHLSTVDPTSIMRAVGEGVEAGAHAAAAAAGEAVADAALSDRAVAAAIRGEGPSARELFELDCRRVSAMETQAATAGVDLMHRLESTAVDHRDKEMFHAVVVNMSQRLLTYGGAVAAIAPPQYVTVSVEAAKAGCSLRPGEDVKLGHLVAKRYAEAHGGRKVEKHLQRVDNGANVYVNSYTTDDIPLIVACAREVVASRA